MDPATSAETSVFIVIFVFTTIAVALFNVSSFILAAPQNLLLMALIAIWAVAGVILGAQLGVRISKRIDRRKALLTLPILFAPWGFSPSSTPLLANPREGPARGGKSLRRMRDSATRGRPACLERF